MKVSLSLKSFFNRELTTDRGPLRDTSCSSCGKSNELPWVFCGECGSPRIKLGHWRVMLNLSAALSAFFCTYYFAEILTWNWMLYALYGFLFFQIALLFSTDNRRLSTRLGFWMIAALGIWGLIFHELNSDLGGAEFFVYVIQGLPDIARKQPGVFYPVAAAAVAILFLPVLFRWKRVYGWVNAYRITLLSIAAMFGGILLVFKLAEMAHMHLPAAQNQRWLAEMVGADGSRDAVIPKYWRIVSLMGINTLRLFVFEIFVFSAVRGYQMANKGKEVLDRQALKKETGFVRALLIASGLIRRFVSALEQMVHYLIETARHVAVDVFKVILAFLRELLVPAVTLTLVALGLKATADLTTAYIANNNLVTIVKLAAIIMGLIAGEGIVLMCKSRYRPLRVADIHFQLLSWLLPNIVVFFLLVSTSLWASSAVLRGEGEGARDLPFYLGMLTKSVAAVLVLLVVFILYRKRNVFLKGSSATAKQTEVASGQGEQGGGPEENEQPGAEQATVTGDQEQEALPAVARVEDTPAAEVDQEWKPAADKLQVPKKGRFALGEKWQLKEKIVSEDRKKQLLQAVGAAKDRISSSELGQKGKKTLSTAQQRLAGKPETVIGFEEAVDKLKEIRKKIEALDRTRTSLSPDHFKEYSTRYEEEEAHLSGIVAHLQASVDEEYSKGYWELKEMEEQRDRDTGERQALEQLKAAGAIDQREFDSRFRKLSSSVEMHTGAIESRRKKLEWYLPWLSQNETEEEPVKEDSLSG